MLQTFARDGCRTFWIKQSQWHGVSHVTYQLAVLVHYDHVRCREVMCALGCESVTPASSGRALTKSQTAFRGVRHCDSASWETSTPMLGAGHNGSLESLFGWLWTIHCSWHKKAFWTHNFLAKTSLGNSRMRHMAPWRMVSKTAHTFEQPLRLIDKITVHQPGPL